MSCIGAPRAPVQGFIYTDTGCNRHEVPIVTGSFGLCGAMVCPYANTLQVDLGKLGAGDINYRAKLKLVYCIISRSSLGLILTLRVSDLQLA